MDACTNCRLCADVCPAACAAMNGELSAVYRMKGLKRNLKSKAGVFSKLLGRRPPSAEELKHYADTVFRCTLCSNCEEVCPLGIRLKELWLSLREDLVQEKAYPSKIDMIRTNLAKSRNVFGEDNAERGGVGRGHAQAPRGPLCEAAGRGGLHHRLRVGLFPAGPEDPHRPGRDHGRQRGRFHAARRRGVVLRLPAAGRRPDGDVRGFPGPEPCGGQGQGGGDRGLRLPVLLPDVARALPDGPRASIRPGVSAAAGARRQGSAGASFR